VDRGRRRSRVEGVPGIGPQQHRLYATRTPAARGPIAAPRGLRAKKGRRHGRGVQLPKRQNSDPFVALKDALDAYPPHVAVLAAFREYLDEIEHRLALLSGDDEPAATANLVEPVEATVLDLATHLRGGHDA
jgi:hypothetical protein